MIATKRKKRIIYLSITAWCSVCKRTTTFICVGNGQYVCQNHMVK